MSPLIFLAIPLVIFAVGSTLLHLASRYSGGGLRARRAPADLRMVAPMLKEQRDTGWPVGSGHYSRR